ncbi:hypothetical protein ACQ4LE_009549 [Meloidogyne hapla]|uniref:S5A_REDUCTASE domain-containing protein n=1 Tax=Meloidogyne hapla TaxID=6305 RepID=A0A1I8BI96_MELHA
MILYQAWAAMAARFNKAPLLLTVAAIGDVSMLTGVYVVYKELRHDEQKRLYYYENYPRILGFYYWGLNFLSFGNHLGDKQQDYDLGKWIYNDVQRETTGTLLSDIWEEREEKPIKVKRPRLQR